MTLSKTMEKFLKSLYYSEFLRYQTPYDREHGYLSSKVDNKGMRTKLSKCLSWKKYENLLAVVEYLGWEGVNEEDYEFSISEAMETAEGCKKLISIDIRHYDEMYQSYGY